MHLVTVRISKYVWSGLPTLTRSERESHLYIPLVLLSNECLTLLPHLKKSKILPPLIWTQKNFFDSISFFYKTSTIHFCPCLVHIKCSLTGSSALQGLQGLPCYRQKLRLPYKKLPSEPESFHLILELASLYLASIHHQVLVNNRQHGNRFSVFKNSSKLQYKLPFHYPCI